MGTCVQFQGTYTRLHRMTHYSFYQHQKKKYLPCEFLFRFSSTFAVDFCLFSCDCLAFFICSDDVKCVTRCLFFVVFLPAFLGDRICSGKFIFCLTNTKFYLQCFFYFHLELAGGLFSMMGEGASHSRSTLIVNISTLLWHMKQKNSKVHREILYFGEIVVKIFAL